MKKITFVLLSIFFIARVTCTAQQLFQSTVNADHSLWGTILTSDKGSAVYGILTSGSLPFSVFVSKFDSIGSLQWTKYCGAGDVVGYQPILLAQSADSGYYLGYSGNESIFGGTNRYTVNRLDKNGNIIFSKGEEDFFPGHLHGISDLKIIPGTDTAVFVTDDYLEDFDETFIYENTWIIKLAPNGTSNSVAVSGSGSSTNLVSGIFPVMSGGLHDGYIVTARDQNALIRISNTGTTLWSTQINGAFNIEDVYFDGNYFYIASYSNFPETVSKIDLNGNLILSKSLPGLFIQKINSGGNNLLLMSCVFNNRVVMVETDLNFNVTQSKISTIQVSFPTVTCIDGSTQAFGIAKSVSPSIFEFERAILDTSCTYKDTLFSSSVVTLTTSAFSNVIPASFSPLTTLTDAAQSITLTSSVLCNINSQCPVYIIAGGATTICTGGSVTLTANPGSALSYQWLFNGSNISGATIQTYNASIAGNYTCNVISACGNSTSNTISVTVLSPTITAGGTTTFCTGGSVTLSANTGTAYQWKNNGTNILGATLQNYNATAAGNYTCDVTSTCGTATSNLIPVTISPPPSASITAGGATTFCAGGSVTLSANTGTAYQWKNNGTNISGATLQNYNATAAGSYTCNVTSSCGIATSNSITVIISPPPTAAITAGGPTTFCTGGSVTLSANSGTAYQWKNNGTNISGATLQNYNATAAGNYTCDVTSTCGTATSNTITVTVSSTPTASITAGGATTFCAGGSVTLSANSGTAYQWKNNGTNISGATLQNYNATAAGNYTCDVTSTCGTATSNVITVTIIAGTVATISTTNNVVSMCSTGNNYIYINASPSGAQSYSWYRNGVFLNTSTSSSLLQAVTGGAYYCILNAASSCPSTSNTIDILQFAGSTPPSMTLSSAINPSICNGTPVPLILTTALVGNVNWKKNIYAIPGVTGQTYTATDNGQYQCSITYFCNNFYLQATSNSVNVEVSVPSTNIITSPPPLCEGGLPLLDASDGYNSFYTYQWKRNGVNISNATNYAYNFNTPGTYTCEKTNTCGTIISNPVIVSPLPISSITPTGTVSICVGQTQTFTATTGVGYTYQWKRNGINIANATNITYTTSSAGTYTLQTTLGSCSSTSTGTVLTLNPLPPSTNTASTPTTVCAGGGVVFNVNSGAGLTYQWQKNSVNIAGATGISYTATTAGAYRVTVTNSNGCTKNSNAISAAFTGTSVTSGITVVGPATFCAGAGTYLKETTSIPGYNYQWQLNAIDIPGATLATYTPAVSGTYTVRVTAACGTALSLQQIITVNPAAIASISAAGSTSICSGSSVILNAQTGAGYSYQWQLNGSNIANETTSSYDASAAGNYTCVVTNTCGSVTSNTIVITIGTTPSASITAQGNTALCGGATVQLDANSGSGLSYQWQLNGSNINGATLISYVAAAAGNYTCAVTSSCGSATSNTITVTTGTVPTQPDPIIGITQSCNPQNNVIFSIPPTPGATSYNWYSLNPAVTINAPNGGTTISVNLGTTTSSTWSLRVEPINGCGTGPFRGTSVRRIISGVTTVTGTNIICAATNGVAYSCNAVSGADSYFWTVPAGATIATGQGTTAITVNFSSAYNGGNICVSSQLNCGFSANPRCYAVAKGTAPVPGNVSGNSTVCPGATGNFSIPALTGVTYNWTVPAGASITAGSGTNAITVQFPSTFSSGNVCVNVTNACGVVSVTKCRSVVAAAPSRPASVSGATSGVCNSLQAYTSAASTGATSYLWSVTGGTIQSGQGTQSVTVQWNNTGATGTLNVNGVNACGNGLVRSVAVNLKPASNGSITGNTTACANTSEVYNFTSLNGATNYLWAVNTASGATVGAGQGTTAATINWLTNGGTVYCTPSNACGSSGTKTLAVSITCREAGEELITDKNSLFNVAAIPNPFNNELNITSTVYGEGVVLKVSDMLGKTISQHLLQTASIKIQTPTLKNGVYFLEVTDGSQKKVIKVVKAE